jgi:hypothetical protein
MKWENQTNIRNTVISSIFTTSLWEDFSKNADYSSNPHTVNKQNEMKPQLTRNIKTNPEKLWGTHMIYVTMQMNQAATCDSTRSRSAYFTTPPHSIWDPHVNCNEMLWKFSCFHWVLWGGGGGSAGPEFRLGTALSTQTIRALLTGFQVLLM